MSRERPGSPRARLFVALDISDDVRSALASWRDELIGDRDDLRPVAEHALHVTLAFLGWQPEKEIDAISAAVESARAERAPVLEPAGVVAIPPRRPRLFALDLGDGDGAAGRLQAAVSGALEADCFYRPEKRPFWPHVTLVRVKRDRRAAPLPGDPPPLGPFSADRLTLYRSTLRPQGALYEPLATVPLADD